MGDGERERWGNECVKETRYEKREEGRAVDGSRACGCKQRGAAPFPRSNILAI